MLNRRCQQGLMIAVIVLCLSSCGANSSSETTTTMGATTTTSTSTSNSSTTTIVGPIAAGKVQTYLAAQYAQAQSLNQREEAIAAYNLLNIPFAGSNEVKTIFDSQQNNNGTWPGMEANNEHYAVFTMTYYMLYRRLGLSLNKSLDSFFTAIDTWSKFLADIASSESTENFWGGAIGYVLLYKTYKNQSPPWLDTLYASAEANYDNWVAKNHQRPRVVQTFVPVGKNVPLRAELFASILAQQNPDGGWGNEREITTSTVDDTAQVVLLLDRYYSQEAAAQSPKQQGLAFLYRHYLETETQAGFIARLSDTSIDLDSTFMALAALVQTGYVSGEINFYHPLGWLWW